MLIGVFSDVHDNLQNLRQALVIYKDQGVESLIFCGDFCSPIPARVMGGEFEGDIHVVFGNGDGDRFAISNIAKTPFPNLKLHGEYAELEFAGVKVAVTHYPFYAKALARTGDYQAVFSGHTHAKSEERIGTCLWLNPGEILGWQGPATCAIYDTTTNSATILTL
jgi:putative phosphoesterase